MTLEEAKGQPLPPNEYLGLKLADIMQDIVNDHVLRATEAAFKDCLNDLNSKRYKKDLKVIFKLED